MEAKEFKSIPKEQEDAVALLEAVLPQLASKDKNFAMDLVAKGKIYVMSEKQMYWIHKLGTHGSQFVSDLTAAVTAGAVKPPRKKKVKDDFSKKPSVLPITDDDGTEIKFVVGECAPLVNFFANVKQKKPELKMFLIDGTVVRYRLGLQGKNKGAIWVVPEKNGLQGPPGDYIGKISPSGTYYRNSFAASKTTLAMEAPVAILTKYLCTNPQEAIKENGRMTSICPLCGGEMTYQTLAKVRGHHGKCGDDWNMKSQLGHSD